jgi:glycosyltransferase involved in cell wall biosynthesis
MTQPLVSIVTPSFNQAGFIAAAVRSVLGQDYPSLEHVVVDGGSTDGTVEILRDLPEVRWISGRDRGQADALRKGFEMARGAIFGWLNADDLYLPGAVSAAVAALQSSGAGLAYGGYQALHEDGDVAFEIPPHPFDFELLLDSKNFVPQPSAFFTREAYEAVGGVDPRYHYALDYDLWLRIGRRFPVVVVDGILSGFRFQSESKSVTAADRFYPEMRRISRRNGGRFFSQMFLHRMPDRHPHLFKAVVLGRIVRERVSAVRR